MCIYIDVFTHKAVKFCDKLKGYLHSYIIDYRGVSSAPGLETSNHFDPSAPRPQTVRLIGGNRY